MEPKDLWTTEHGSSMWGMFKSGISDHDYSTCRVVPTKNILAGYRIPETWAQTHFLKDGVDCDCSYVEIGQLINQLLRGNINYLWHVTSSIVIEDNTSNYGLLRKLRQIVLNNPSKKYYYAIKGMAGSQKLDETKRPRLAGGKGYRTAARTALFGVDLLTKWEFNFKPCETIVNLDVSELDVNKCLDALDQAFEDSPFPLEIDEKPFRDYLYKIRKMEWEGKL